MDLENYSLNMKIVLISFASPLTSDEYVKKKSSRLKSLLADICSEESSIECIASEEVDAILALILTGGVEQQIAKLTKLGKPVLILTHHESNSLAAGLEAASLLREENTPSWIIQLEAPDSVKKIERILKGVRAAQLIRGSKIGILGEPSPWLVYSGLNESALREKLGVSVIHISLSEFFTLYDSSPIEKKLLDPVLRKLPKEAADRFEDICKMTYALRELFRRYKLSGLTMNCFDIIKFKNIAPCLSASLLQDMGFTIGCEGDVPALVAMILVRLISGTASFIGNVIASQGTRITLAHCTIPLSLTSGYEITSHFESGVYPAIKGEMKPGMEATLLRFSPNYETLRAGAGLIVEGVRIENGCRTQVTVDLGSNAGKILEKPLGNHHILALGDLVEELKAFCKVMGIKFEEI